jgi:hypothetical protein
MFCAPGLVFGDTQVVGSHFHVLISHKRFRWCGGRKVPFLYFTLPDSFSTIQRASSPIFIFCILVLVFGGTEGVGSRFHVLRSQTRYQRYRGHRVSFSCFARSDSISAVPRASVSFSCLARPDSFSEVSRASGLVFLFCASGLIFNGPEGVRSRYHVLRFQTRLRRNRGRRVPFSSFRSRTHYRRCGGRRVPFSCFALPDSFAKVSRASCSVFMFCPHELIFGGTEGVGSRFHVLRSRTLFRRCATLFRSSPHSGKESNENCGRRTRYHPQMYIYVFIFRIIHPKVFLVIVGTLLFQ